MNPIPIELLQTVTGGTPPASGAQDPFIAAANAKTAAQVQKCGGLAAQNYVAKQTWLGASDAFGLTAPLTAAAWKDYSAADDRLNDCVH